MSSRAISRRRIAATRGGAQTPGSTPYAADALVTAARWARLLAISDHTDTSPDLLPLAVRAWTTRADPTEAEQPENAEHAAEQDSHRGVWRVKRRYPTEALIFDTETDTTPAQ